MGHMKRQPRKRAASIKYNPSEWDESQSAAVTPEKRRPSEVSTSIRLPKSMVSRLRKVAQRKGDIGYQTLIKIWIAERLEKESAA